MLLLPRGVDLFRGNEPGNGTGADCLAQACRAGGPSGLQTSGRAGSDARDVRADHDGRRRIERNAAKLMGFRQFSTLSVMAVKSRCLEV